MDYIVSGRQGQHYTELFERAMRDGPFTGILSAVAYATVGGVKLLERTLSRGLGGAWDGMTKKWLVGIDWCRSDPPALDRLAALDNSEIKVPNGESVVRSQGCTPSQTYHPKLFMLTRPGRTTIICGSGNLSRNGMLRGCEVGGVVTLDSTATDRDGVDPRADALLRWFNAEWRRANSYSELAELYAAACRDRVRHQKTVPTEDDTKPEGEEGANRARVLTEEQIHELRTFKNFWIDAGALGANLGAGIPGNQLDMKRFTRAFFGAGIEDLQPQTEIDRITLVWDGVPHSDRTLKYGDNHMDKLNVPPAGDRGRGFYKGKALLFTRRADGDYDFHPGAASQRRTWKATSIRQGVVHRLSKTREWGLF